MIYLAKFGHLIIGKGNNVLRILSSIFSYLVPHIRVPNHIKSLSFDLEKKKGNIIIGPKKQKVWKGTNHMIQCEFINKMEGTKVSDKN